MPSTTAAPEMVTLSGGRAVSVPALQLAWHLEERGCYLRLAPDGIGLLVGPRDRLNNADRDDIREDRVELLAIVRDCEGIQ